MEELGGLERNVGKRTRVLGKTIGISVKLGEYYANPYVDDPEAAEERLVWAVTALLKEQKRREEEGVKEGEGEWMSNEEIGGALECMGSCVRGYRCLLIGDSFGLALRIEISALPICTSLSTSLRPLSALKLPFRRTQ